MNILEVNDEQNNQICVLHIGKTGGSFVKHLIEHNIKKNQRKNYDHIHILNHQNTINSTADQFGGSRQLIFCFRDPISRFSSAFYSRQRMGRPTYNSMWSPSEAIAFSFFNSANDLAEALFSIDERTKSAAYFAMNAIQHLRLNLQHYLHGIDTIKTEKDNIIMAIETSNINKQLPSLMQSLGFSSFEIPKKPKYHKAINPTEKLSLTAIENLKNYWKDEIELYNELRRRYS